MEPLWPGSGWVLVGVAAVIVCGVIGCSQAEPLDVAALRNQIQADRVTSRSDGPVFAITDLPPLAPPPDEAAFESAIAISREIGANGAVLTFTWADLEPRPGQYQLDELLLNFARQRGRVKLLGLQVIHTADKSVPADLVEVPFDAPRMQQRFQALLAAIPEPLAATTYLSIGNESDIYLDGHPQEAAAFARFLKVARSDALAVAPHLQIGTTLTAAGLEKHAALAAEMDVQIVNYYHIGDGFRAEPTAAIATAFSRIMAQLDSRPILFQELGYPVAESLGGTPAGQAEFVERFFDLWEQPPLSATADAAAATDGRSAPAGPIVFANYFMMYDFPREFGESLVGYYQIPAAEKQAFVDYFTSLGLRQVDGLPRPGWDSLASRLARFQRPSL